MGRLTLGVVLSLITILAGCDVEPVCEEADHVDGTARAGARRSDDEASRRDSTRATAVHRYEAVQARFADLESFLSKEMRQVRVHVRRIGLRAAVGIVIIEDAAGIAEMVDGLSKSQHHMLRRTPVGIADRSALSIEFIAHDGDARRIDVFPTGYAIGNTTLVMDRFSSRPLTAVLIRVLSEKDIDMSAYEYDWDALANGYVH